MQVYKITLTRNINRPRLPIFQPYMEIVTFIKAVNLKHASDVAKDIGKEHNFVEYQVELMRPKDFADDLKEFLGDN